MPPDFDNHIDYQGYYSRFVGKLKLLGNQLTGLCPFHEDTQQSFGCNCDTGQWICRAGCGSGNVIDFHARINNLSKGDAVADLIKTYNVPEEATRRGASGSERVKPEPTATEQQAIPLETLDRFQPIPDIPLQYLVKRRAWSPETIQKYQIGFQSKGKRKAFTIPVFDSGGELVNIRTYAPETAEKIKSWGKGHGATRLYPISILSEARAAGKPVLLCEGEPDALCGISRGLCCITQTAGAETWKDAFNAELKGLDLIICYDNDEAGKKGAARAARHLPSFAKSVSILQWPEFMADKEDLTDWFVKHGKSAEELLELKRGEVIPKAPGQPEISEQDKEALESRLERMNSEFSVIMLGGKCVVMRQIIDPIFSRRDITFSSFNDFRNFHSNEKYWQENGNGKARQHDIAKIWLDQQDRSQYQGIVFLPEGESAGYFNLWRGFAVEPKKGECKRFLEHLFENIAGKNDTVFDYLLKWMADLVQNPGGERKGISIVMRGEQGVGKGCFAQYYGGIFGNHFLHITQSAQLLGKFNHHLKDALLVFADEAFWAGDKAGEGVLKAMITEPTVLIEPKGKDPFRVKNHIRLMIASNSNWVVPAGMKERRFFVIDVSEAHMQDRKYFDKVWREMDKGGRAALLNELLETDIKGFDFANFPRTEALLDQKISSLPTHKKFWLECLRRGSVDPNPKGSDGRPVSPGWEPDIRVQDLYGHYIEFCKMLGERHPLIDKSFSKQLIALCSGIKKTRPGYGERYYGYILPGLDDCRKSFDQAIMASIPWDT